MSNLKSKIFKLLVTDKKITIDYAVQAYNVEDAITALSKKLKIEEDKIKLSKYGYTRKELDDTYFKNPFIREWETISKEDLKNRKIIEKAQADLNALLRPEEPKKVSDGCLYVIKDIDGKKTYTNEVRFRPFYSTIGINDDGSPKLTDNNKNYPREGSNRPFVTDTNDIIYDDADTVILPNTDYIFPIMVDGNKDENSLNSLFRFNSSKSAYEHVRQQIIDAGISHVTYRLNNELTYLEACDSWLCGTGVKMGIRECKKEKIEQYNKEMSEVVENGKLKYPPLNLKR